MDGLTSVLIALSSGALNHVVGHDTVGTGAAGGAGVNVTAWADRPERFAFRPAGGKRTGGANKHFARQGVGAARASSTYALLAIDAGDGFEAAAAHRQD